MNDFETEKELDEKTVVWQFTLGDAKGHASRFLFFWGVLQFFGRADMGR